MLVDGLVCPDFYLQLYAVAQGIDPSVAFYAVSRPSSVHFPS